jgi:hypothetical protein
MQGNQPEFQKKKFILEVLFCFKQTPSLGLAKEYVDSGLVPANGSVAGWLVSYDTIYCKPSKDTANLGNLDSFAS